MPGSMPARKQSWTSYLAEVRDGLAVTRVQAIALIGCSDDLLPELLGRARSGDVSVLPRLRAALDEDPALWQRLGDLAAQAERAWVELASGPNSSLATGAASGRISSSTSSTAPERKVHGERLA